MRTLIAILLATTAAATPAAAHNRRHHRHPHSGHAKGVIVPPPLPPNTAVCVPHGSGLICTLQLNSAAATRAYSERATPAAAAGTSGKG